MVGSLRQCLIFSDLLGPMPEPGDFDPGTMVMRFRGTLNTWGIGNGISKGYTWLDVDVKSIRPPVSPTSSVYEIEVHGWTDRFHGAANQFIFDCKTKNGHLHIS